MVTVIFTKAIYDNWQAIVCLMQWHVNKLDDSGLTDNQPRIKMATCKAAFAYLQALDIEAKDASEVIYEYGL